MPRRFGRNLFLRISNGFSTEEVTFKKENRQKLMNASHGKTFDLNLNCLLSKFSNEIVINWFDSDNDSHLCFTERRKKTHAHSNRLSQKKTIKNRQQTKKWLKQKQFKERKKTFVKNLYGNNFDN